MSFADIIQSNIDNARWKKQDELTALQQGYVQNAEGKWEAIELQQQKQSAEAQQIQLLQSQLQATQEAVQAQQAKVFADSIAGITNDWATGNTGDALRTFKNTPGLKQKLQSAKSLDFNDLDVVNFSNPEDVDSLVKTLKIDRGSLSKPEVQNALTRTIMKVQGKDGNYRMVPVDSVIRQTNSHKFYSTKQRDALAQSRAEINAIIAGVLPQTVEAEKAKIATETGKLETQDLLSGMWNNFLSQYTPEGSQQEKEQFAKDASLIYSTMYPELFKTTGTQSGSRRDSLEQFMTAYSLANPNASPGQWQGALNEWVQKSVEGVGSVRQDKDIATVSAIQTRQEFTPHEAVKAENTMMQQLDNTQKKHVQTTLDTMQTNYNTASNIDRVLKTGGSKVEKGVIDNALTWTNKILGTESAQAFENVDFNTRSGMLLVSFVKSISGTAVSDQERARLVDIMLGGNLSDENYVRQALGSFSSELKAQNKQLGSNVEEYAPHSTSKYTKESKEPLDLNKYKAPLDLNKYKR